MVGNVPILNLNSSDFVASLSAADLLFSIIARGFFVGCLGGIEHSLSQNPNGLGFVCMLRTIALAENNHASWSMYRADCRFSLVTVLATGPRTLGGLKPNLRTVECRSAALICKHSNRKRAGLRSTASIGWRHALPTMATAFILKKIPSAVASNFQNNDARQFALDAALKGSATCRFLRRYLLARE